MVGVGVRVGVGVGVGVRVGVGIGVKVGVRVVLRPTQICDSAFYDRRSEQKQQPQVSTHDPRKTYPCSLFCFWFCFVPVPRAGAGALRGKPDGIGWLMGGG